MFFVFAVINCVFRMSSGKKIVSNTSVETGKWSLVHVSININKSKLAMGSNGNNWNEHSTMNGMHFPFTLILPSNTNHQFCFVFAILSHKIHMHTWTRQTHVIIYIIKNLTQFTMHLLLYVHRFVVAAAAVLHSIIINSDLLFLPKIVIYSM